MESQYKEEAKPFAYDYAVHDHFTSTNFAKKEGRPAPSPYHPAPSYKPVSSHPEPQYKEEIKPFAYEYAVNDDYTGTNFAKREESDGHNTQGYYSVALPDGRIQHVNYVVDNYGDYSAEVTYEGEAHYPRIPPCVGTHPI
ncbi:cuticle protein 7-like [Pollicipes pollicipes]|uniref:cuticle protein 7-like n=1 Tax=Pollicipes pollicipes TaxID=41117 RepID=UPI0018856547|nr:cuticle protein 7-like [Pollicipes pollicipes]